MADTAKQVLWRAEEIEKKLRASSQRLNPKSYFRGRSLSRLAGMKRAHVSVIRLPPGKESFAYHAHMLEEEWIYIVSGRGIAEIDGKEQEVRAGDFMGFAAPQVAHLMKNSHQEELVYLMGGESLPVDVLDYPHLGKRYLLMVGEKGAEFYELKDPIQPFGPA